MIGVFDSGLGGLSVLAALVEALPQADFSYYADTAHVPYGNKSEAQIQRPRAGHRRASCRGMGLPPAGGGLQHRHGRGGAGPARRPSRHPVVGVEPGIKPAAQDTRSGRIAVLATEATAKSARLHKLIRDHAGGVEVLIEPCPGWATHVEMLQLDDPALAVDVRARIEPLLERASTASCWAARITASSRRC
jgi:glutamate racemase